MQKIEVFKTSDGKLFEHEREAVLHEADLDMIAAIDDFPHALPSDFADAFIEHWQGLARILIQRAAINDPLRSYMEDKLAEYKAP